MTAAENRQRRRAAKLDQILDRAMELLTTEGPDALTLGRLAEAMSVTSAALYRYISSKDDLVARLQDRSAAELSAVIAHNREAWARSSVIQDAAPPLRPLVTLFGVARLYVRLREEDSPHILLLTVLVGDPRSVLSEEWARRVTPRWLALLGIGAEILTEAAELGALSRGDAIGRATLLWATLQGIAQLHKVRRLAPRLFAVQPLARESTAGLALRWGAKPDDVEAAIAAAERLRLRLPPL